MMGLRVLFLFRDLKLRGSDLNSPQSSPRMSAGKIIYTLLTGALMNSRKWDRQFAEKPVRHKIYCPVRYRGVSCTAGTVPHVSSGYRTFCFESR